MPASRIKVILSTLANEDDARELSRALLNNRLAACVNVDGPVTSIYRWDGEIQEDEEWLMIAKTRHERQEQVVEFVEQHHPYDCPEVIVLSAERSSADYEQWIQQEVR